MGPFTFFDYLDSTAEHWALFSLLRILQQSSLICQAGSIGVKIAFSVLFYIVTCSEKGCKILRLCLLLYKRTGIGHETEYFYMKLNAVK